MKFKQCQRNNSKPTDCSIKIPKGKRSTKSETIINHRSFIDIESKSDIAIVLQKGSQFIESYNSAVKNHCGDAESYFRKTLRNYSESDFWTKSYLDETHVNDNRMPLKKEEKMDRRPGSSKRTQFKRPTAQGKQTNGKQPKLTYIKAKEVENSDMDEYMTQRHSKKPMKQSEKADIGDFESELEDYSLEKPSKIAQMFSDEDESASEETETTEGDDEKMREIDDMIIKTFRELEQVAEVNQMVDISGINESLPKQPNNSRESQSTEDSTGGQTTIREVEKAGELARDTANLIYKLKMRITELLDKDELTEEETEELAQKNEELKVQMVLFKERTKMLQFLVQQDESSHFSQEMNSCNAPEMNATISSICSDSKKKDGEIKTGVCSCCSENLRQSISTVPTIARKLSQSYIMQEKLAAENADLESVRFKLQEELLTKDQSLECLQREIVNLHNEMKLLAKENTTLNEKLKTLQQKDSEEESKTPRKASDNAVMASKLQEYSDNTYDLEKQLADVENDVKYLHDEICEVQKEREYLEKHRKMMDMCKPWITPHSVSPCNNFDPSCIDPFSQSNILCKGLSGQILLELIDQYNKLENDIKLKLSEVTALRDDYDKLKNLTKEAEEFKKITEHKMDACEKIMMELKSENQVPVEQERQLSASRKRFEKAQVALKEQQILIKNQKKELEDITTKYLEAQEELEDQRDHVNSKFHGSDGGMSLLSLGTTMVTSLKDSVDEILI